MRPGIFCRVGGRPDIIEGHGSPMNLIYDLIKFCHVKRLSESWKSWVVSKAFKKRKAKRKYTGAESKTSLSQNWAQMDGIPNMPLCTEVKMSYQPWEMENSFFIGKCKFEQKIKNAAEVGAKGVIVVNNQPDGVITMSIGGNELFFNEANHRPYSVLA